jgi:dihydropteroate synthase
MYPDKAKFINVQGRLIDLSTPCVMGVINITPDSFYTGSRSGNDDEIVAVAGKMLEEGAAIIDLGGYSSRPGAQDISAEEERNRVIPAIKKIIKYYPDAVISVDTFRADVAIEAVEKCGASIINDITGGDGDSMMIPAIARMRVPYILMHMQGTPSTMQLKPTYDDIVADILKWFSTRIKRLVLSGVNDIIIDPGFGFGKTITDNFELLDRLDEFSIAGLPVLAGLSRKSMVWKTLNSNAENALNGTTAVNTIALLKGADILRVHDVKEAVETVKLVEKIRKR